MAYPDVTDTEVLADLAGFQVFRNDRRCTRGGGVLIAVGPNLSCTPLDIVSDLEMLWLIFRSSAQSVLLGVCYRAPHTSPNFASELNNILIDLGTAHPNSHILLFGDFNYPGIDWQKLAPSGANHRELKDFIEVCLNANLTQLVREPTRVAGVSANILDLILTTNPESLSHITYLQEISDHKVIHAEFSFCLERREKRKKTILLYEKGNYDAINNEVRIFPYLKPNFTACLSRRAGRYSNTKYRTWPTNSFLKLLSVKITKSHGTLRHLKH